MENEITNWVMKYSWASIASSVNHGNFLIEYNLKRILAKAGFPESVFEFDTFADFSDEFNCKVKFKED